MRQPDVCFCFGGRCWREHCPQRKKPFIDPYDAPKPGAVKKRRKTSNRVRTLSDSLKEIAKHQEIDNE